MSSADVLLMIHLLTMDDISMSAVSPFSRCASVASASRPRRILFSKRRLNSEAVPSKPGLTKFIKLEGKVVRRFHWIRIIL